MATRYRKRRIIDEVGDVTDAQMRAAAEASSFRGVLDLDARRHFLEKLARDFGPGVAKLAEELAERERATKLPYHRRDLGKLLNAGWYGFR